MPKRVIKEESAQAGLTDKSNKREKSKHLEDLLKEKEIRVPVLKVTIELTTTGKIMVSKWEKHQKLTNRITLLRKTSHRGKIELKNQTKTEEGEQYK